MGRSISLRSPEMLPPPDARLVGRRERIETPVNPDTGLIEDLQLINDIKATVDPSYRWTTGQTNIHHYYWPKSWYQPNSNSGSPLAKEFRELAVCKARVPITFHNWLHRVVEPAPLPCVEAMEYTIEAWDVARRLFQVTSQFNKWGRLKRQQESGVRDDCSAAEVTHKKIIDMGVIDEVMEESFHGAQEVLEEATKIPREFRIFNSEDPFYIIARRVGSLVAPAAPVMTRYIAEPIISN